jgi:type II secretory pathway component PulM
VTRRQELILAAVGALLVLVAATLLLVRPTRQATAEARADRQAAITESQTLRDQIKALEALKPNEAELKAKASLARAEFPASPALPGLVDALQDSASLAGVELGTVAPTTPKTSTLNPLLAEITTTSTSAAATSRSRTSWSGWRAWSRDPTRVVSTPGRC